MYASARTPSERSSCALGTPSPLDVFGPEGTEQMLLDLREAYRADPHMTSTADATSTHLVAEGVVYERNGVKVTAFRVDHAAGSTPAFGCRIGFADRCVVISGDTRPSENLARFAEGADVLLHEVIAARPGALRASERATVTFEAHTSPVDAGRLFQRLRPELAVHTHVSLLAGPAARAALASEILPRTRSTYAGPLLVGENLMTVVVDERVDVRPFAGPLR